LARVYPRHNRNGKEKDEKGEGEYVGGGKKEKRKLAECLAGEALFPGHKDTSVCRHDDKPEEL